MKKLAFILALSVSACSSNPEIPDDSVSRTYRSTYGGGGNEEVEKSETKSATLTTNSALPHAVGPVAMLDGKAIDAASFNIEMKRLQAAGTPVAYAQKIKLELVSRLVDQQLMSNAVEKSKIIIESAEVDQKLIEVKQEFEKLSANNGKAVTLESMTKQLGISPEEFRKSIEQTLAIEKLIKKEGYNEPDAATLRKFYDDNPTNFTRPESIRARHILLKVEKGASEDDWKKREKEIKKLHKKVKKKKSDFEAIAKAHSEDTSAKNGGDLGGFFIRGVMTPDFENAAFALKKGEISKPIRTPFGWHIIRLDERKPKGIVPFEELDKVRFLAKMKDLQSKQFMASFIQKLRSAAKIEILEDNIK